MSTGFFKESPTGPRGENNVHVMVDLETMGTISTSPVITIGAVLFDPHRLDTYDYLYQRAFLRRVKISEAVSHSTGVDGGTLEWWLQQDPTALKALVGNDAVNTAEALDDFNNYCQDRGRFTNEKFFEGHAALPVATRIWAKGPDFDCKMLEELYGRMKKILPFRFHEYRCVRTVIDLGFPNGKDDYPDFEGTAHDARDDAIYQALMVQHAYQRLGLGHGAARFLP